MDWLTDLQIRASLVTLTRLITYKSQVQQMKIQPAFSPVVAAATLFTFQQYLGASSRMLRGSRATITLPGREPGDWSARA